MQITITKYHIIDALLILAISAPFIALSLYYQHNIRIMEKNNALQRFDICIERFHPSDCATNLVLP